MLAVNFHLASMNGWLTIASVWSDQELPHLSVALNRDWCDYSCAVKNYLPEKILPELILMLPDLRSLN